MTRVRGLGRGLEALIPNAAPGVDEIDVDLIVPNPEQPRGAMDEEALRSLADSIREHGVLQPLVVTAAGLDGVYQLIAGERRLRASRLAGLRRVPVVVKEAASEKLLELALVENLQREDLNALEEAQAYRRLADDFEMTQEQIASRVGRSRTAVANSMRLLGLGSEIREHLAGGLVSEGHARALLALEGESEQVDALREIVARGLSVRETEALVRTLRGETRTTKRKPRRRGSPETEALESKVREALGTKVELRRSAAGSGRLVVHFYSDEELESLLGRLDIALS